MHRGASVLLVIACALTPLPAGAQEPEPGPPESASAPPLTWGTSLLTTGRYVWRGFDDGNGLSLQPASWVGLGGFTLTSWFNFSPEAGGLTEHDLTLEYTRAFGPFDVTAGAASFHFVQAGENTDSQELFFSIQRQGPLAPSFAVFHDARLGSGTYASLTLEHEWPISALRTALKASASLGYNHRQWTDRSGLSDLNLGVQATGTLGPLHLSPFVNHSRSLDPQMVPTRTWGGFGLAIER